MIKKFNDFVNENYSGVETYELGGYEYYATLSFSGDRTTEQKSYHIIVNDGDFEGDIILKNGSGGRVESFDQVDYIEWEDNNEPIDFEDIEEYTNDNLTEIMLNAPVI